MRSPYKKVIGVILSVAVAGGGVAIWQGNTSGGAPAGTANLWVDTNGGTCTRQAVPAAYVDAAACSTFDAAFDAGSCNDLVLVKTGSYGSQALSGNKGCSIGTYVTLQGEDSAADHGITISGLTFAEENSHSIALRKMFITSDFNVRRADNILLDNVDNGGFFFESVADMQMKNSEIVCPGVSNGCDYHSQITAQYCDPSCNSTHHDPRRLTIGPGNYFHGWQAISVGQHTECLQVGGGDGNGSTTPGSGVLVIGNKFNECCNLNLNGLTDTCTAGIHLTDYQTVGDGHATSEVAFVNNWIGPDIGNTSVQFGEYDNSGFFFNSTVGLILDVCTPCTGTPFYYIGNNTDYTAGMCSGGITFRNNRFDGGTCDASDSNGANDFVDIVGTDFDLHLVTNTSGANNLVPTNVVGLPGCPSQDYDLQSRPANTNCDAGADERN